MSLAPNLYALAALVCALDPAAAVNAADQPAATQATGGRDKREILVVLGDSITDGFTYGQVVMQALRESGRNDVVICAGKSGDDSLGMAERLDDAVLFYDPTTVFFLAGTNDANRDIPPEAYESALREIAQKVTQSGATMVLATPCINLNAKRTGEEQVAYQKRITALLDGYEAAIRKVAAEYGFAVAENRQMMLDAVAAGRTIMIPDGIHPNYEGQLVIARSLLDAMGFNDVPLPETFKPERFPGLVTDWQMRVAPKADPQTPAERLTEETVTQVVPDASWVRITLPEPPPAEPVSPTEWTEQIRIQGFTRSLATQVGKGPLQGYAIVHADEAHDAYVNTAARITSVFLNGKKVFTSKPKSTGHHLGKERIPVHLNKGDNVIVVEVIAPDFILSVTRDKIWEDALFRQ